MVALKWAIYPGSNALRQESAKCMQFFKCSSHSFNEKDIFALWQRGFSANSFPYEISLRKSEESIREVKTGATPLLEENKKNQIVKECSKLSLFFTIDH